MLLASIEGEAAIATSRVKVGRLTSQRTKGRLRSEEAERSIAISSIRRRLGVATVKAQASSLLGRLQMISPGTSAAIGRRRHTQELERHSIIVQNSSDLKHIFLKFSGQLGMYLKKVTTNVNHNLKYCVKSLMKPGIFTLKFLRLPSPAPSGICRKR